MVREGSRQAIGEANIAIPFKSSKKQDSSYSHFFYEDFIMT
jgi:hypothetical protein